MKKVWIVTSGEPLPGDEENPRLLRAGLLAQTLAGLGYSVTWWTAAFDHRTKRHRREPASRSSAAGAAVAIRMLPSPGYGRNISPARLWDHARLARTFAAAAPEAERPDLIVASLPPLELCAAAVRFGRQRGVPVVVDVRDLWPDTFLDAFPRQLRRAGDALLRPYRALARYSARHAAAVLGPSQEYVDWALHLAGRSVSSLDAPFPFAYPDTPPADEAVRSAERFWDEAGVRVESREFRVCFFGTLGSQFDLDTVLAAARQLEAGGSPVRFILCGSGPAEQRWREAAAGCSNVLLPGWVDAAAIWVLMRRCQAGIAPYHETENFLRNIPNKPIEYMSAGLAVLTSLQGAQRNMLTCAGCGIFYRSGSTDDLAAVLRRAAADSEALYRLSTNARETFERQFAAEVVYPRLIEHLVRCWRSRNAHIEWRSEKPRSVKGRSSEQWQ
jgi:glycosyltransferase involved in cell wall biosynthesis